MHGKLRYRKLDREALSGTHRNRLWELMQANYDQVSHEQFLSDLSWKDQVILLVDVEERIRGFTTLALNPLGTGAADFDILYSGDTVIEPACWGSQELVRGFCETAGQIYAASGKTLYWYLLSKGHRTYRYLPLFTRTHYPGQGDAASLRALEIIADRCSRTLFAEAWHPDRGILHFSESLGQLKPALAHRLHERAGNPHVTFFLKRNPGFAQGDELVCLAELSPENMRGIALRTFLAGMSIPQLSPAQAPSGPGA